jgi:hypothetical protein
MVVQNMKPRIRIKVTSGQGAVAMVSSHEAAWILSTTWVTPVTCKVIK